MKKGDFIKRIDLTNKRFGRLIVSEYVGNRNGCANVIVGMKK